jgi:hypothetical protein
MDKTSKQIIQGLMNELALERQLADQLADALINGGMDRQFQAIAFHEHTRNGFMYPGVKVGDSPESSRRSVASDQVIRQLNGNDLTKTTKTSGQGLTYDKQ